MTAPLLNTIWSSSPCSRMASRTSFSFGSHVATMDRPTESGLTPFLRNVATNSGEGSGAERGFFFCRGVEEQRAVLCHHAIEKINLRKDVDKVRQLTSRDEHKLPAGSPEGHERVGSCVLDNSVVRKRAVIIGGQTADVHGPPAALAADPN